MEKKLEEIVKIFKKEGVVERIIGSEDPEKTFKEMQQSFESYLEQLKENVSAPMENGTILPDQAVPICVICLMAGMDDCDLFFNYEELTKALRKVEGNMKRLAIDFYFFLGTGRSFLEETEETLIKEFFY